MASLLSVTVRKLKTENLSLRTFGRPTSPDLQNQTVRSLNTCLTKQGSGSYPGYGSGTLNLLQSSLSGCHSSVSLVSFPNVFILTAACLSSS